MRRGLVVDKCGVGELARPALRGTLDQSARSRVVPRLRVEPTGNDESNEKD
jgi:hypothetical protein